MATKNHILKIFFHAFAVALLFSSSANNVWAQDDDDDDKAVAIKLFEHAQNEHEKGNLAEAVKLYSEAIDIFPEFPEAEYQRATAFVSLKRFDEAEKGFRKAIELREGWHLPYIALGSLLVQQNRFKEAEPILNEALKLDTKNFSALVAMTDLRLQTKAAKEILLALLSQLREATTGTKTPATVWTARGTIERAVGDKENAKRSLDTALSLSPKSFNALTERSSLYEDAGDYERALADAKAAQMIEPKVSSVSIGIARIYAKAGKKDEAIRILDSLDEKAKQSSEAQSLRASLTTCDGNPESLPALEKSLEQQPKNTSLLACLGYGYRTIDPKRSMEFYRRAAEIEPNNISFATGYASALVQARRFENAVNILRRIIELAPDDYAAHANLAIALYELKLYPDALVQFDWLKSAKPDIAITYFYIATARDYMEEYAEALAAYQKFLSLADAKQNQLEIEKVNLRLPSLKKQISRGEGKKKKS